MPPSIKTVHCRKRLAAFPYPAGMSLTKLSLARNNKIIPGQGEWLVTSRLGTGKSLTFFYSDSLYVPPAERVFSFRVKKCGGLNPNLYPAPTTPPPQPTGKQSIISSPGLIINPSTQKWALCGLFGYLSKSRRRKNIC